MISFYPGPSKIHSQVKAFMWEACESGILSVNHRSKEFVDLSRETILLLKERLAIPEDYTIFFISSATEAWEIIAQEFINKVSLHIFNGAFGRKWYENSQKIKPVDTVKRLEFDIEEQLPNDDIAAITDADILCITQNETSNATRVSNEALKVLKQNHKETLIAVDATSSMGGEALDFALGDIWFASVQKCFGLPAGMALMICSPQTIGMLEPCMESKFYNSMSFMGEMMRSWQTTYTPNVLSIYLLKKTLEQSMSIERTAQRLLDRSHHLYQFFSDIPDLECLVSNGKVRSSTVIAIKGEETVIAKIKNNAKERGIVLGNGYGKWKSNTFRVANFPAHSDLEFEILKDFFLK